MMMGWRGSSKSFSAHPSLAVLAKAELDMLTNPLSMSDRATLFWGVRIYHRTILEIMEAKSDGT
jgi:hypothetical protein